MLHIALFEPKIAPNTGNIIRLIANNGCWLHLIEPMGFRIDDAKMRRAGLDYHDLAKVTIHPDYAAFKASVPDQRIFAITTKGTRAYTEVAFQDGDVLLFGAETTGLAPEVMATIADGERLRIPMLPNNRSLNLSNAVAIVSYEAWRQLGFVAGS
ncbi:tRNA (cytidine(34)-2'-O)-methyltransferase [Advenella mimigardefordensis]|uniref:tRNA (cytidine(34)-2'-O)-methyltransferase n=1 Tax=Advenella mimigardefordensis (strain DSM 17166 / LMG 22922 / DPN7) TaxID=1247726 RepID=W0PCR9_ADVMD|nr:tRNA (cytidine(34)-2'-O)-methyltransferase [Advenella mimigardefordensis]AHG62828.1 tRNA (cytidine/uridine-2'-O-)-methyltransferase TrmL [Advenella mimigardefordensis DPN7]